MDSTNFFQQIPNKVNKTKKEQIYEYLKQEIISNKFKPGTVLVERQICDQYNISRTPVREAIQQLVSEGLLTNIPNKGSVVSSITYENIVCVYEVREYIEGLAARLCSQRITESELEKLRGYYHQMDKDLKENSHSDLFLIDNKFHECIIKNSKNYILINIWYKLQSQVMRITRLIDNDNSAIANSHELHRQLLEAIEKNNPNDAESIMREHIRNSKINQLKLFAPNILNSTL